MSMSKRRHESSPGCHLDGTNMTVGVDEGVGEARRPAAAGTCTGTGTGKRRRLETEVVLCEDITFGCERIAIPCMARTLQAQASCAQASVPRFKYGAMACNMCMPGAS